MTIKRTLYRSGESEYELNRTPCRLIDIQELLSDAGIGKQQHVIVGQGKIDSILNAKPQDRRAVIEEAAGVLKYRKRKEKAERRLSSNESDITRLRDLLREVKRQMKPLEKQASAAKEYSSIKEELDKFSKFSDLNSYRITKEKSMSEKEKLNNDLKEETDLKLTLQKLNKEIEDSSNINSFYKIEELNEKTQQIQFIKDGLNRLLQKIHLEISRSQQKINSSDVSGIKKDLSELLPKIAEAENQIFECENTIEKLSIENEALSVQVEDSQQTNSDFTFEYKNVEAQLQRILVEIENQTRKTQQAQAKQSRSVSEQNRGKENIEKAKQNKSVLEVQKGEVQEKLVTSKKEFENLKQEVDANQKVLEISQEKYISQKAKVEAMQSISIASEANFTEIFGWEGFVEDKVDVKDGYEVVAASAFSNIFKAGVLSAQNIKEAAKSIKAQKQAATFLVVDDRGSVDKLKIKESKDLLDVIKISDKSLRKKLTAIFTNYFVVDNLDDAINLYEKNHESNIPFTLLTKDGDVISSRGIWNITNIEKVIATKRSIERAQSKLAEFKSELSEVESQTKLTKNEVRQSGTNVENLRSKLIELDNKIIVNNLNLDKYEEAIQNYDEIIAELQNEVNENVDFLESLISKKESSENFLEENKSQYDRSKLDETNRGQIQINFNLIQSKLNQEKIRMATLVERVEGFLSKKTEFERILFEHVEDLSTKERLALLQGLAAKVDVFFATINTSLSDVAQEKQILNEEIKSTQMSLDSTKRERDGLQIRLEKIVSSKQTSEIKIAELNVSINQLEIRIRDKYSVTEVDGLQKLIDEVALPELPQGVSLESHILNLSQRINFLGPVNPLAEREFEELEQRFVFLSDQLEDVVSSKKDCQKIITSIDDDIEETFSIAFEKTQRHFGELFEVLFPNGKGEVKLVDDGTGVDLIAKPAGKNVSKLSLLSGGERALASLAFIFAIFKACPSPFYVLDEVEAALDDVNLQRFINLLDVFRTQTQLIVITHQKRTMKAANVLYGVSMASGSGITKVVHQNIEDVADLDLVRAESN